MVAVPPGILVPTFQAYWNNCFQVILYRMILIIRPLDYQTFHFGLSDSELCLMQSVRTNLKQHVFSRQISTSALFLTDFQ